MAEVPTDFYSDAERQDAERFLELIESADPNVPMPREVTDELQEIGVRGPKPGEYESRRQVDDTLYIKAWPGEEPWYAYAYEEQHLDETVAHVVCVPAVYPVAWLILGRQLDATGNAEDGRKFAEVSLAIEEHPATLCEVGAMVGAEGEHELALGLFSRAFEMREDVPPWARSRAALGVGVTLLEDGQLEKAHEAISIALKFEPDSEVAKHALSYVEEALREQGLGDGLATGDPVGDDAPGQDAPDE